MYLTYLLLIGLIAIAIMDQTRSKNSEQTEFIPVRINDREVEAQKTNVN